MTSTNGTAMRIIDLADLGNTRRAAETRPTTGITEDAEASETFSAWDEKIARNPVR
jgi:hypothetical protein